MIRQNRRRRRIIHEKMQSMRKSLFGPGKHLFLLRRAPERRRDSGSPSLSAAHATRRTAPCHKHAARAAAPQPRAQARRRYSPPRSPLYSSTSPAQPAPAAGPAAEKRGQGLPWRMSLALAARSSGDSDHIALLSAFAGIITYFWRSTAIRSSRARALRPRKRQSGSPSPFPC